jgi:hypothetical protein
MTLPGLPEDPPELPVLLYRPMVEPHWSGYNGPRRTCTVCIRIRVREETPEFERLTARYTWTTSTGREVHVCERHKMSAESSGDYRKIEEG